MEDIGPPDSWESADLDESMSRLLVSSKKNSDSFLSMSSPLQEFVDETAMPFLTPAVTATAGSSGSGERCGVISEDALSQVDQFLREALEKPRERISSECAGFYIVISVTLRLSLLLVFFFDAIFF